MPTSVVCRDSMVSLRYGIASGLAYLCLFQAAHVCAAIQFRDVTEQTGISFIHTDGSSGKRYIVETVSAGLALFDYDRDGDVDIYFLNGAPLKGTKVDVLPRNALYRNDGDWRFADVTNDAGVGDTGYGLGVAAGDYDNDGDLDLYLNNYGPNVLYRNDGDGTFSDVTKDSGVTDGDHLGAGACFLDIDKDGDLDLYVSHYVDFTYENHQTVRFNGYPAYVGPMNYRPTPDALYRNNGDGTFTDVSVESGVAAHKGPGMGMVCADYDNDGDTDIYVGNDVAANFIFENDGTGVFEEVGLMAGLAYDLSGNAQGTMGVECGDYNNDGLLDFHVTSYQRDLATLYRNMGDNIFEDVTQVTGAGDGTLPYVTWGNGLVDFDNDGNRDIFIACGHLHDNVELFDKVTSYHTKNVLVENTGDGRFVNVSDNGGDGMRVKLSSRGAGFDDLDNDGDIDVVVLNSRREPTILRNDSPSKGHWIQICLQGTKSNRDGVGARVNVVAGDLTLIDEVHSGRGYQSHYGMRLHFGLGDREKVDRIEVRWIGGGTDIFENISVDRVVVLTEGTSTVATQR
ncbi:MAG: CRTAC1 family protein [Phycisphaerales bacterium]|nr:MAG: CRTAC1 family protein [Phycisphaerales bacterium]